MSISLKRIDYTRLNARQQENYNFQKVSAVLADYGFATIRLTDDWQGADFIAQHIDGETFLKVQLKGRLTFGKKYMNKGIYVAFHSQGEWYLYPHDELLTIVMTERLKETRSWSEGGAYSFPHLSQELTQFLARYRITGDVAPGPDVLVTEAVIPIGDP